MTTSTSSTNPLLPIGSWVQLDMTLYQTTGLNLPYPTVEERTIGQVKSAYTAQGRQFYQIIWNPGGFRPETGMYTADQLVGLSDQQAQQIKQEMATGEFTPQGGWNNAST